MTHSKYNVCGHSSIQEGVPGEGGPPTQRRARRRLVAGHLPPSAHGAPAESTSLWRPPGSRMPPARECSYLCYTACPPKLATHGLRVRYVQQQDGGLPKLWASRVLYAFMHASKNPTSIRVERCASRLSAVSCAACVAILSAAAVLFASASSLPAALLAATCNVMRAHYFCNVEAQMFAQPMSLSESSTQCCFLDVKEGRSYELVLQAQNCIQDE